MGPRGLGLGYIPDQAEWIDSPGVETMDEDIEYLSNPGGEGPS